MLFINNRLNQPAVIIFQITLPQHHQKIIQLKQPVIMSLKTISHCLKFSSTVAFMLFCLNTNAQLDFSDVDDYLKANQKLLGNDLAALVYKDGKIIYQKEMGDFNIKTREPIASCSKWLTTAMVMTFVDEGKISLDEPISTYLPIYESYGKKYITIRNCLTQTTGITDNSRSILKANRRRFESLEDEVNSFAKKEIADNPGKSFFYGDMGINIAARVMEVMSKKNFESLMKQRIFAPLEMKNSGFLSDYGPVNPSGSGESTAADYMNFLSMILNKGMFKGKRILSEKAIEEMQKVQTQNAVKKFIPELAKGYEYGLGEWIQAQDENGNSTVVSCPGLFGTWPYVDKCRGYACIIFVKKAMNEERRDIYMKLKNKIDEQITAGNCN